MITNLPELVDPRQSIEVICFSRSLMVEKLRESVTCTSPDVVVQFSLGRAELETPDMIFAWHEVQNLLRPS